MALLRKRAETLSSAHRSICNTNVMLCQFLGIELRSVVSRSELPLILQKVDLKWFEQILFNHFGIKLPTTCTKWFACDGKELRGSVAHGDSMKTFNPNLSRITSTARTLVINVLAKMNIKKIKAHLEKFTDDFHFLLNQLRNIYFL